jgi:hypothetical protein
MQDFLEVKNIMVAKNKIVKKKPVAKKPDLVVKKEKSFWEKVKSFFKCK